MYLVTYAGQDGPMLRAQKAMDNLNQMGLDTFRKRGMPEAIREIVKQVATKRHIAIMLMASDSRIRIAVEARNEAMYLIKARNPEKTSSGQIARWFARDHTSVFHSIASHQERNNLPKLVGYNIIRVRQRNANISAQIRAKAG